jgi:hypothetical protein
MELRAQEESSDTPILRLLGTPSGLFLLEQKCPQILVSSDTFLNPECN